MKSFCSDVPFLLLFTLIFTRCLYAEAQDCSQSGTLTGTKPPEGKCSQECCEEGKVYATYNCSPPVTTDTAAILTHNNFEEGGDGGDRSECDHMYHSNDTPVVALSTGWFDNRNRCFKNITISYNGTSVEAMVVDQCSSTNGCDEVHAYQPPCRNNIVDASDAVWEGLRVPEGQRYAELEITWSDV